MSDKLLTAAVAARAITAEAFADRAGLELELATEFLDDWLELGIVQKTGDDGYRLTPHGRTCAVGLLVCEPEHEQAA